MRIKFLDEIARKGPVFTFEEALGLCKVRRETLWTILSRLEKKGWIERIEKGKYMIVPLGAGKGKYTLNEFVIGSMLVKPYSISYWSALHFYGLTEQIPNIVLLQTTARKKDQMFEIFGVKYRIVRIKKEKFFGIRREWIEGIVEVAKALKNENFDADILLDYAGKIGNSGVIRRLGYLCDILDIEITLPKIETRNYLYLDPTMPKKGLKNARWKLMINLNEKMLGMLE